LLSSGAGKIGSMNAEFLAVAGDYAVDCCRSLATAIGSAGNLGGRHKVAVDIRQADALRKVADRKFAVLSAASLSRHAPHCRSGQGSRRHYLDLTEDVASTRAVKQLELGRPHRVYPAMRIGAGIHHHVASDLASRFDTLNDVRMRVGALPKFPSNALNYNLTWSTTASSTNTANRAKPSSMASSKKPSRWKNWKSFSLDGHFVRGIQHLGRPRHVVRNLGRQGPTSITAPFVYPGHAAIMKALLNDLRLRDRRELLKDILENAVPINLQDVVIVFATVSGMRAGQLMQENLRHKIYAAPIAAGSAAPYRSRRRAPFARCSTC